MMAERPSPNTTVLEQQSRLSTKWNGSLYWDTNPAPMESIDRSSTAIPFTFHAKLLVITYIGVTVKIINETNETVGLLTISSRIQAYLWHFTTENLSY